MIRRPPRSTLDRSSAASDVYKRQPHNVHEMRPGSYQNENLIFVTYYNAGLRVFDIRNKFRPEEVGFFIPPAPEGQKAPMFNDLYVDTDGLIYVTDRIKGGLYILEYTGPKI